jgi:hypothetical protein
MPLLQGSETLLHELALGREPKPRCAVVHGKESDSHSGHGDAVKFSQGMVAVPCRCGPPVVGRNQRAGTRARLPILQRRPGIQHEFARRSSTGSCGGVALRQERRCSTRNRNTEFHSASLVEMQEQSSSRMAGFNKQPKATGCPYCARRVVAQPESLTALRPALAAELHPTKNGRVTADTISPTSGKAVWWQCRVAREHIWQATIVARDKGRFGCPYCGAKRVSQRPELVAQWDAKRNAPITPDLVSIGSGKQYWWHCAEGPDHVWQASVSNRAYGRGCPFCAGKRRSITNSLATLQPALASQWHGSLNGDLSPERVVAGSNRQVWWSCPNGPDHVWKSAPNTRVRQHTGCPACAGQQVSSTNSLASLRPELAAQWHPARNGELRPEQFTVGTNTQVWWLCPSAPTTSGRVRFPIVRETAVVVRAVTVVGRCSPFEPSLLHFATTWRA